MLPPDTRLKKGLREQEKPEMTPASAARSGAKTIKQIADELGVSKQAVYRYVKKHHINEVHHEVHHGSSVMCFNDAVQTRIKQGFMKMSASGEAHHDAVDEAPMYAVFEDTIKVLREQLEAKDQQIASLNTELATEREHGRQQSVELAKLADQAQQLQAMHNTSVQRLLDEGKPRKKGFFERIRKDDK